MRNNYVPYNVAMQLLLHPSNWRSRSSQGLAVRSPTAADLQVNNDQLVYFTQTLFHTSLSFHPSVLSATLHFSLTLWLLFQCVRIYLFQCVHIYLYDFCVSLYFSRLWTAILSSLAQLWVWDMKKQRQHPRQSERSYLYKYNRAPVWHASIM